MFVVVGKYNFRGIAELNCHKSKAAALSKDFKKFEHSLGAIAPLSQLCTLSVMVLLRLTSIRTHRFRPVLGSSWECWQFFWKSVANLAGSGRGGMRKEGMICLAGLMCF